MFKGIFQCVLLLAALFCVALPIASCSGADVAPAADGDKGVSATYYLETSMDTPSSTSPLWGKKIGEQLDGTWIIREVLDPEQYEYSTVVVEGNGPEGSEVYPLRIIDPIEEVDSYGDDFYYVSGL